MFSHFPFPSRDFKNIHLKQIGQKYYESRAEELLNNNFGLTDLYNLFHSPDEESETINVLRSLQEEMDSAVLKAYGWDDVKGKHGFHETKQGIRYTISGDARRTVLQRLLKLNNERYEEEVSQGLHDKQLKTKQRKHNKNTKKRTLQMNLF